MASTTTSPSNFQPIFDAALSDYAKRTKIDLAVHPFAQTLQACDDADAILTLFQEKANQFQAYRDGNRKLIDCLKPVVQFLHTVAGILSGAATLVSLANRPVFSDRILIALFPGTISTYKGNPRWCRCPPYCACNSYFRLYHCNIRVLQASIGVSASYDALVNLFERVGNFLNRLRIYNEIPLSPSMTDIITKIMVEVLSVLSLATKQIKKGRLSMWFCTREMYLDCNVAIGKFMKKLFGESKIEDALNRLDRLTLDEGRMAGTETLQVVHRMER
jgi:hypothetical protein